MKKWIKSIIKFLEKRDHQPKKKANENIWNVPNPITFSRVIISFILIYMFIVGASMLSIVFMFVLGMLTDFFDGYFARRLKQITEFGRQFDMLADRLLMIVMVLGIILTLIGQDKMHWWHLMQIFMILSRELISFPFAILALVWGKRIPDVRYIGKATTVLQAVAFPLIILSVFYSAFNFSIYFSVLTGIVGIFSGMYYIADLNLGKK